MARTRLLKSAARFGVRYGQSVKRRIAEIEAKQRKKQLCPFCRGKAKRLSKGIWQCKKCEKKFAGHSYYLEPAAKVLPVTTTLTKPTNQLKQSKAKKSKAKDLKEGSAKNKEEKTKEKKLKEEK